ncbi:zinc ribbon domain-containing protein [Arcobacter sp. 15-2]|uniref:zinc ribbon domain-containing protein n=1 Tax=Arcobacter sp. 15-2 TaxID=3374109 RepID=UPI00399CF7B3
MNKHLEQLVKLSTFDKDIVNFDPKIKNEEEKLKSFTQVVTKLTEDVDKLYVIIDDTKNKRIKNDLHLKELSDKLAEIAGKHKLAKNEKEVKALQLEEEIAKEQVDFANEEIARLDSLAQTKTEELEVLKAELLTEEDSVKELKEAIDKNIAELEKEKNSIYEEKSVLVSTVDSKVLSFYEKIKRWAHESAVVPVKKQACYGCNMKLNDRFYSEFTLSNEIMTCPHCGRIIYKENEPAV